MRKKSFLRAVAIVVCIAFFSLSVPAISAAKDSPDKTYFKRIMKNIKIIASLLPFVNVDINDHLVPPKSNISKKYSDSNGKIKKVTGTINSIKKPDQD